MGFLRNSEGMSHVSPAPWVPMGTYAWLPMLGGYVAFSPAPWVPMGTYAWAPIELFGVHTLESCIVCNVCMYVSMHVIR